MPRVKIYEDNNATPQINKPPLHRNVGPFVPTDQFHSYVSRIRDSSSGKLCPTTSARDNDREVCITIKQLYARSLAQVLDFSEKLSRYLRR
jgi:hypothetical protein